MEGEGRGSVLTIVLGFGSDGGCGHNDGGSRSGDGCGTIGCWEGICRN